MSNKEEIDVVIDSNEAEMKPKLMEILTLHEDVREWEIEPLEWGDIHIENCAFERKTPSDFASSLEEGRLREQVEGLASKFDKAFILVEGNMEDFSKLEHSDMPAKSLRGMTASIIMRNGIPVVFCSKTKYLCDIAVRLARKEKEDVSVVQAEESESIANTCFIEDVFRCIDGVGVKTAEHLAEEFPSLQHALNAETNDFKRVKGIGPKLSEQIEETIQKTYKGKDSTDSTEKTAITI